MLADHHRIHNQRELEIGSGFCHGLDNSPVAQSARLGGIGRYVIQNRTELMQDQYRAYELHLLHLNGVLHREQCDHGFAIYAHLMKSFEVGLNSGAA